MNISKPIFLLFLILALSFPAQAQKFELGKVSLAELQQKQSPIDTTAAAAVLYNKGRTYYRYDNKKGFSVKHEYEFRIKIYKTEGLEWANFSVPFYVGYENLNNEMVKFSDGVTYNLENGAIVKTKLTGEGRFKKDVNELWNEASIAMPNAKVGSVIEFKYVLSSENITEFPDYQFQYGIPVHYSEYRTEIPQFFIYKPILTGFGKVKTDSKIASGYQNFANEYNQTINLSFQQINTVYTAENMPALKPEPFVDNINNYRSAVLHELEKVRFPDVPEKDYSMTWEGVSKMIYKEDRFGKELRERNYFEPFLASVIKNTDSETAKANAILALVKRTVSWDGKYGYLTKKGVKKAFEDRSGNIAEINFILISMLNHAGINADPVLISTISNGIPVFPNRTIFNSVIAIATIDGKSVLLDATDPYSAPNILPLHDLNWSGRQIRQDGSSVEIPLMPKTLSKETFTVVAAIDLSGKTAGKARILKTDYESYAFLKNLGNTNGQDEVEKLENRLNGISIGDYIIDKTADLSKPVSETFTFVSENDAEIVGDKMFVRPLLFLSRGKNPFVMEKRELPIYFGYPKQQKFVVNLEIPAGYAVESLPKPISLVTGEDIGLLSFAIQASGNKIQITVTSELKVPLVAAGFYDVIKEYYKKMHEKLNEMIVLKKN